MSSQRMYGGISTPRAPRFMGMAMLVAGTALGVILLTAALVWLGRWQFGLLAAVGGTGLVFWMVSGRKQGRSKVEQKLNARAEKRARRKGTTSYISGPTSKTPDASFRAPGMMAPVEAYEGVDTLGFPFGMLWNGRAQTATVLFSIAGEGRGLNDQPQIDSYVDQWAQFQQDRGQALDLKQISVTTQCTRDQGHRLPAAVNQARHINGTTDPASVGEFVRETNDEIVGSINTNAPQTMQHVALTFSAAGRSEAGLDARTAAMMLDDLAILMPQLKEELARVGSHTVSNMTMTDITDYAFVAYNPDRAAAVEQARIAAQLGKGEGTNLDWLEVGPELGDAAGSRDYWAHSGHVSQSFSVWKPPAGFFRDDALDVLQLPDGVSEIKRVTHFYWVMGPEESQAQLDADKTNRVFELRQGGKSQTAEGTLELANAEEGDFERVRGAAVVRLAFVMTVTLKDGPDAQKRLAQASTALSRACSRGVQMSIRPSTGSHDAGHALSLGLGLIPGDYATVKSSLRRSL